MPRLRNVFVKPLMIEKQREDNKKELREKKKRKENGIKWEMTTPRLHMVTRPVWLQRNDPLSTLEERKRRTCGQDACKKNSGTDGC
jgi:hypothetical protein